MCDFIGNIGFNLFHRFRNKVMIVMLILITICIVLNSLSLLAITTQPGLLEKFKWSHINIKGPYFNHQVCVGFRGYLIIDTKGNQNYTSWDDTSCKVPVCEPCKNAATSIIVTAVIALATVVTKIPNAIKRGNRGSDNNLNKMMAIVLGIIGVISALTALINFSENCINATDSPSIFLNLTGRPGLGWYLLAVSTFIRAIMVIINIVIPTPKKEMMDIPIEIQLNDQQRKLSIYENQKSTKSGSSGYQSQY